MEQLVILLASAGALVSVFIQLVRLMGGFPKERPKLAAFIVALILVVISFLLDHEFTAANLDKMAGEVGVIFLANVSFYEVVAKPTIAIVKRIYTWFKEKRK